MGRVAYDTLSQFGTIDLIGTSCNVQAQSLDPRSAVLRPSMGSRTAILTIRQKWGLIPIIRKHILLNPRLKTCFRGKQIQIEGNIYNSLFHTAFSQSRNDKHDLM